MHYILSLAVRTVQCYFTGIGITDCSDYLKHVDVDIPYRTIFTGHLLFPAAWCSGVLPARVNFFELCFSVHIFSCNLELMQYSSNEFYDL